MKRIQEKIKDLVDVHVYQSLKEFISDPPQTLAAYHFTDMTSEMMGKWLDALAETQMHGGTAKALAGFRGVGKSHFLATIGAIASHPELRSKITDMHVAATAQRLKRRRHPVAFIRRGNHPTLIAEIKDGIAIATEHKAQDLPDSLPELVQFMSEKAADLPFVLIIDTAFDRASRVERDDGAMLGEIADLAKKLNIFVAVALDDDIAGADGVNAAIAQNYTIDYLDQEHLYRIVDTHIFPKHRQTLPLIQEIYSGFREVLPRFQWSNQKFNTLYPLHPAIPETAPFIRLYAPEFAMLGFASEAGNKVLGRPANSLVALDEVFDKVENSLRKAKDLQEAFSAYDRISQEVITKIPVMQRLQAKLILKGLLLLSLDGDGTTASEIGAAMLIYDEREPLKAVRMIEETLETFAAALPVDVRRKFTEGEEIRFSLKVSSKDSLNDVLAEAAKKVSPASIEKILRRFARERFSDWTMPLTDAPPEEDFTDLLVNWRGGTRRGRIVWNWNQKTVANIENKSDFLDWEIVVTDSENAPPAVSGELSVPIVVWQAAALRAEEEQTLRRYYVLLTETELLADYSEQVRAAGHTHRTAVEKIWKRIFLEDAKLLIEGMPHPLPENIQAAQTATGTVSEILSPLFDFRFPAHPTFPRPLSVNDVTHLISGYFSGTKTTLSETQELAKFFALPLGLVSLHGDNYILNSDEEFLVQPFVKEVMKLAGENQEETVSLKEIYRELKKKPYGLVHEAAQLVLAALVAGRHLEFVTSKSDRINRRSLDLQIIWDDIAGVAAPETALYGGEKLADWARLLTANDSFKTTDNPAERTQILEALEAWLADWQMSRVLERFEKLPNEILNTKIWRIASQLQKTFGIAARTVESTLNETVTLEEGLQRIADAFSDSEKEFFARTKDLITLEDFINGVARREKVWSYLALCEATHDDDIEVLRGKIYAVIEEMKKAPAESLNLELGKLWQEFHTKFSDHFNHRHYAVMKSHLLQEKFDEILRSDEWWEFENLSALPVFQKNNWKKAQRIVARLKELNCPFDLPELLRTQPFCGCSFRLSQTEDWEQMPQKLFETVAQSRAAYRKTLLIMGQKLVPILEGIGQKLRDPEATEAADRLVKTFKSNQSIPLLDNSELNILRKAFEILSDSPYLQTAFPTETGFLSREELQYRLNEWLNELPGNPVLLKV